MLRPIAQELAENIAHVIGYDVVISDTDGIIIGCSDPKRGIGTLNEACAIVARTGKSSEESEDVARRLKGTKAGVTYPVLDAGGHVVGTIAITGAPEKVKPFALLVKNQAELYLKERLVARELLEHELNLQTLVADIALFREGINDPHVIETKAALMGYDRSLNYSVLVIDIARKGKGDENSEYSTPPEIHEIFNQKGDVVGSVGAHKYVVFRSVMREKDLNLKKVYSEMHAQCKELADKLKLQKCTAKFGIGSIQNGIAGLASSYREARIALEVGEKIYPFEKIHFVTDFRVEELLLSSEPCLLEAMVERELAPLFQRTDCEELQETIMAWCESGFSVVRASERLHVHRTTVDYRLEKLESILAVKPRDFREMSRYYWAVILWRSGRGHPKKEIRR